MSNNIKMTEDEVRTIDHAVIGVPYMGIGTAFDEPVRHLLVTNHTNGFLMFSFDGIHDHFPLVQYSFLSLDITQNNAVEKGFFISTGQRMYVRQIIAPTTGEAYITTFLDKPA